MSTRTYTYFDQGYQDQLDQFDKLGFSFRSVFKSKPKSIKTTLGQGYDAPNIPTYPHSPTPKVTPNSSDPGMLDPKMVSQKVNFLEGRIAEEAAKRKTNMSGGFAPPKIPENLRALPPLKVKNDLVSPVAAAGRVPTPSPRPSMAFGQTRMSALPPSNLAKTGVYLGMNLIQEQFFDRSYNQTLLSLGISPYNEKTAGFFGNVASKFKRAPTTPGAQTGKDISKHLKSNAPTTPYKSDPMADVAKAHHTAKKKDVDLNQLYGGTKTPGSIADKLPKEKPEGSTLGALDKAKGWWGQRSPWAKAGIGAAAALPIAGGLYAAGGMNPSRPQQPPQQY
jgi:hypothetical protein